MNRHSILNQKITKITNTIGNKYHKLIMFINQIPVKLNNDKTQRNNLEGLKNYYDSLIYFKAIRKNALIKF